MQVIILFIMPVPLEGVILGAPPGGSERGVRVQRLLAACGLLKFFDCPLIRSQEYLALVYDIDVEH
jgi:hypothetical protein